MKVRKMRVYKSLSFILVLIIMASNVFAFNEQKCWCCSDMDEISLVKNSCCTENSNIAAKNLINDCFVENVSTTNCNCLLCKQLFSPYFFVEVKSNILPRDLVRSYFSPLYLEERFAEFNLFKIFYYLSFRTKPNFNSYYLEENLSDRAPPILFV